MATYSLASGLFVFDKENQVTGAPVAALESIAAAGFRETELMAEGDEWQTPGSHDARQCRKALERLEIFPHTIHTPMSGVNLASSDEGMRIDSDHRK